MVLGEDALERYTQAALEINCSLIYLNIVFEFPLTVSISQQMCSESWAQRKKGKQSGCFVESRANDTNLGRWRELHL